MSISATDDIAPDEPVFAHCDDTHLHVRLHDGRRVAVPLWWYPRLLNASPEARAKVEYSPFGLHWPDADEDLSVEGLLSGRKAPGAIEPEREAA